MNEIIRKKIIQAGCFISIWYLLSVPAYLILLAILRRSTEPKPWAVSLFLPAYFGSPLAFLLTLTALILCVRVSKHTSRNVPLLVLLIIGTLISGWTAFLLCVLSHMGSYAI